MGFNSGFKGLSIPRVSSVKTQLIYCQLKWRHVSTQRCFISNCLALKEDFRHDAEYGTAHKDTFIRFIVLTIITIVILIKYDLKKVYALFSNIIKNMSDC